ncbi:MAG: chemotaxis protein CheD [Gammaproteobacteria bacterium]|nr:chemotaxis protein CheD [Gammaproteobacteria bacterium]
MPEIVLLPGEFYFGNEHRYIKTLLGSCVAITMWDSNSKVGGMCHYKLPHRPGGTQIQPQAQLDGSYGEEAIQMFMESLSDFGLTPEQMAVGVYGAGDMFGEVVPTDEKSIGKQNLRLAYQLLAKHGFKISHEALGGSVSRRITLDLFEGVIKVQGLDVRQQKWL